MTIYLVWAGSAVVRAYTTHRDADAFINNNVGVKYRLMTIERIDLIGEGDGE